MSDSMTQTSCGKPGCTKVHTPKWTRAQIWKLFGEPALQVGSVNDPRAVQEHGCVWNEKWIYFVPGGHAIERVALWNRYDLRGVFRVKSDGSVEPEFIKKH